MNKIITKYLALQTKRTLKHFPSVFIITILLIVSISLSCVFIIDRSLEDDNRKKITIGITGDLSQTYLGVGINALQSIDSSRFSIEFLTMEEEDARQAVLNNTITGYIRIPDGFVKALTKMNNIPVVYVTGEKPSGFGSVMMNEIAKTISDIVIETQKGIYGMQNASIQLNKKQNYKQNTTKINVEYIDTILNRTNTVKTEYIGISDGLSMGAYFVCGGIMIFLLLWGITCNSCLYKKDRSNEKLLVSKGHSVFFQVLCEYLIFLLITVVMFTVIFAVAGFAIQNVKWGIKEIDSVYPYDFILYVIKILPVIIMITSLQFMLYEMISGYVGVLLVQFVYAIGSAYICGCLYPSSYFPEHIRNIASFLPTGFGITYMRQSMSGSLALNSVLGVSVFSVLFILSSAVSRSYRIGGKQ